MPTTQTARSDATRSRILDAAFAQVYIHGFRAASLNTIVAQAQVTKGALFHHFPDKKTLGYAVVDEVVAPLVHHRWLAPLADTDDPVTALQLGFREHSDADIASGNSALGCPLNNLAQEMSPLDPGFRTRLDALYSTWRRALAAALTRGQRAGTVRADLDADDTAALVVLAQTGIWGAGKSSGRPAIMRQAARAFHAYLETLRPRAPRAPAIHT